MSIAVSESPRVSPSATPASPPLSQALEVVPPRVVPSAAWREYFQFNRAHLRVIPWHLGAALTTQQLAAVVPSVQEFQLGESSEGRRFVERAVEYAHATGDWQYVESLRLFIAEEQRHGRELGNFLDLAGAPPLQKTTVDGIFRAMRHLAGLELMIAVLVTAEVVAQIYYQALQATTECQPLRVLCDQILADEVNHVQFQCERLAMLRQHRTRLYIITARALHRGLLAVTCIVLWKKHGATFRMGGFPFIRFCKEVFAAMETALQIANPTRYSWPDTPGPIHRKQPTSRPQDHAQRNPLSVPR